MLFQSWKPQRSNNSFTWNCWCYSHCSCWSEWSFSHPEGVPSEILTTCKSSSTKSVRVQLDQSEELGGRALSCSRIPACNQWSRPLDPPTCPLMWGPLPPIGSLRLLSTWSIIEKNKSDWIVFKVTENQISQQSILKAALPSLPSGLKHFLFLHFVTDHLFPPDNQTFLSVLVTKGLYLPASSRTTLQTGRRAAVVNHTVAGEMERIAAAGGFWHVPITAVSQSGKIKGEGGRKGRIIGRTAFLLSRVGGKKTDESPELLHQAKTKKNDGKKEKKRRKGETKDWKSAEDKVEGRQEQEDEERCDEEPDRRERKTTHHWITSQVFCFCSNM